MVRMTQPLAAASREPERLPLPMPFMNNKPLVPETEARRVAGDRTIVPDDDTKVAILKAGSPRLVGSFRLCLDDHGHPTDVDVLHSTGSPRYDAKIVRTIKDTWVYSPFVLDGSAHAVCTGVTFVYSQG
jgi:hypothetical protein